MSSHSHHLALHKPFNQLTVTESWTSGLHHRLAHNKKIKQKFCKFTDLLNSNKWSSVRLPTTVKGMNLTRGYKRIK